MVIGVGKLNNCIDLGEWALLTDHNGSMNVT